MCIGVPSCTLGLWLSGGAASVVKPAEAVRQPCAELLIAMMAGCRAVRGLVSLGSPHRAAPATARDMTGGALTWVNK